MTATDVRSLAASRWISQAVYAAVELGLLDALADRWAHADELAGEVGADPIALTRLLRALATLDLVEQSEDGAFGATESGTLLRSDVAGSAHSSIRLTLGPRSWRHWGAFVDCVRTGRTAAELLDGLDDPFAVFDTPEARATFDQAMADGTARIADAVVAAYDVSALRTVVDVGGGYGALVVPMLRVRHDMSATIVDLDVCEAGAVRLADEAGLSDRLDFRACDVFRDALPAGADAYLLKSVLHDFDDERAVAILRACGRAMRDDSRLLVIEVVLPDRPGTDDADRWLVAADLNMLVSTGGRERSRGEHLALLAEAGFVVQRVVLTDAVVSVIEAQRI